MSDVPDIGAVEYDRRVEVEALLREDETALGRVWGYLQEGLSAKEMAEREGLATTGFVSNYNSLIAVLRDGRIPDGPSLAQSGARRIRSWLKSKRLSPQLRAALTDQESLLYCLRSSISRNRRSKSARPSAAGSMPICRS